MVLIDTVLPFIGVLLGLVVLHELGHFVAAKLAGVRVEEFGVGLPPRIGKGWQFGETLYSFNWLPIGGFVRLTGEEASGLLITAVDQDTRMKDHFVVGDRILKVNGKRVVSPDQFLDRVFRTHGEEKREFTFDHTEADGRKTTWTLTTTAIDDQDSDAPPARNMRTTEEQRAQFINEQGEATILGLTVGIDPRSLGAKSRLTRVVILAAGALVNAILPFILFAIGALIPDNVSAGPAVVTSTIESAPAHQAGIRAGDRIVAIDGEPIQNAGDLARAIQLNLGETLLVTVERPPVSSLTAARSSRDPERFDAQVHARLAPDPLTHVVQPGDSVHDISDKLGVSPASVIAAWGIETEELKEGLELELPGGITYVTQKDDTMLSIAIEESVRMASIYAALGIDPVHPPPGIEIEVPQGATGISIADASRLVARESPSFGESVASGWTQTRDTFVLVRNRIRSWIAGGEPIELSGPVGIARVTGEVVDRAGWSRLIELAALISLNLAIINILPLPMLDGGRIMFVVLEIIRRGKKISPEREGLVHMAGFAALLIFIVVISYFDIIKAVSGEPVIP
jgi:regulator of sigma E protease